MTVRLSDIAFDPWQALLLHQRQQAIAGQFGATCVFVGTIRDFNEGDQIKSMTLTHYPGMTEKQLENIVAEASRQWAVLDVLVVHRVGTVTANEAIVLVVVWAAHRGDAYDANRYIMEALKSKAPFWKKERLDNDRERWVSANSGGFQSNESVFEYPDSTPDK